MKKGPKFEADIVGWFKDNGWPFAHRLGQQGRYDKGDVGGIPGVCLQLKNQVRMELGSWVKDAEEQCGNAAAEVFAVVHKRKGKGDPAEQYVTMPLRVFAWLLRRAFRPCACQ